MVYGISATGFYLSNKGNSIMNFPLEKYIINVESKENNPNNHIIFIFCSKIMICF